VSATAAGTAKRSRWLDWTPKGEISGDLAGGEPTKPSKPGSVGFVGATSAESPEIDAAPNPAELSRASAVLSRAGVRLIHLDGMTTVGIWSDLDGPEIRKALRTFGSHELPVRYLDGADVPTRYKMRRVDGEPVPMNVLAEMQRQQDEPWKIRDRMLQEMRWCSKATSWAEWKAAALNRLFQERGVTGRPGRITAETVRHGERAAAGAVVRAPLAQDAREGGSPQ
jgi:hypothetical protein